MFFKSKKATAPNHYLYLTPSAPSWTSRGYQQFADEAYIRNVVANRAVSLIANGAASILTKLYINEKEQKDHPLIVILNKPNPYQGRQAWLEHIYSYKLLSGNAFIQRIKTKNGRLGELYALRPDKISILTGNKGYPSNYRYHYDNGEQDFPIDPMNGNSDILHIKQFHPLSEITGLSSVEAAAYAIDQHNEASKWNQALLQHSARPTGAIVVKGNKEQNMLTDSQYKRLKESIDKEFSGGSNAGRPLLLEGGLDWKEMGMSPRDMDFLNSKHSSARDIALAFGVPPQLLGIPGDNRYSNLAEARLALWEQTIIPMAESFIQELENWLNPLYQEKFKLSLDLEHISALSPRREELWKRIAGAGFLSDEEKRRVLGV